MGYKVAIVGATGAVGREIIKTLAERQAAFRAAFTCPPASLAWAPKWEA